MLTAPDDHAASIFHLPRDETDFAAQLAARTPGLTLCTFASHEAAPVRMADADVHHQVATQPETGRLVVAFVDTHLSGRALALALRCPLVVAHPTASFSCAFGAPGSAAVYAAAAARIGTRATERHLFGDALLRGTQAVEIGLASFGAGDVTSAVTEATTRFTTILGIARAALVTWPFSRAAAHALVDG